MLFKVNFLKNVSGEFKVQVSVRDVDTLCWIDFPFMSKEMYKSFIDENEIQKNSIIKYDRYNFSFNESVDFQSIFNYDK
jgi:hypothetical protein